MLCPHDFNWTSDSAIIDKDLRALLSPLKAGTKVTVTVDACHNGDFLRARRAPEEGTPRTPIRPAGIAAKLQSLQRVRRLRSVELVGNSAFISACRPWETAKDTSFDGHAAGAFTHFFQNAVRASSAATLDDIVEQITPFLASYEMHPVGEGSDDVRGKPYAAPVDRGLDRGLGSTAIIERSRSLTTVWEYCWSADIFGQRGDVAVAITLSGNNIVGHVRTHFFGGGEWHVPLNGNAVVPLNLAFGVQLRFAVRDWSLTGGALRFQLSLELFSRFFGSIPVGAVPVSVRLDSLDRDAALYVPQSAADFLAIVNLRTNPVDVKRRLDRSAPPTMATRAPGEIVYMADGTENWGPNWREDRAIWIAQRARATKRVDVVFDPVRGGGYVTFVRWCTDDERDPSFVMHIGNGFFGGWGSVHYTVQGVYQVDDPFPTKQ